MFSMSSNNNDFVNFIQGKVLIIQHL